MITEAAIRERVQSLPSLPTSVVALGQAVADERCTVDRILAILQKDPSLSATILKLANTVAFGGARQVTDLRSAIQRLGFDAILHLGRSATIIRTLKDSPHLDPETLWQHSVAVGLVCQAICRLLGKRSLEETAFLGGLIHDIGKIALDCCFPVEFAPVLKAIGEGQYFLDAEREHLGVTHADVGAMVAVYWKFADLLVEVIQTHHDPQPGAFLPNLVNLCDLLVRTRIPNYPMDGTLCFNVAELPCFQEVFGVREDLDLERLTFSIDDELDHAIAFVKIAFEG